MSTLDMLYDNIIDVCTAIINMLNTYIEYSLSMNHEKEPCFTLHVLSENT